MQVRILDDSGELLWSQSPQFGMTCLAHREDGKIDEIIAVLKMATERAEEERLLPAERAGSNSFSEL